LRPGDVTSRADLARLVSEVLYPDPQQRRRSPFNANYVGKLEDGVIHWPKPEYRAALRAVLGVGSDKELGFYNPRARSGDKVESVDRRELLSTVGALVGAGISTGPMLALLGGEQPPELPRQVGREHIDELYDTAGVFERWDNSHGGAVAREIADAKLRQLAPLLRCSCPPHLQAELYTAMAQLAGVVAFMLFDAYQHADAHSRFTFALQCAERGGSWHQRAMVLSSMARQAVWCGQPDDGLTYVEMGFVRADRLTATERAMLHTVRARSLAKLGPARAQDALAAVGAADEAFAQSRPSEDPPWMRFYDEAQHHGDTAHALYDIEARTELRTEAAARFRHSIEHHEPEFARSRAISRTKLASLTMRRGDPQEAAYQGRSALEDAGAIRSRRTVDDLRELHRLAASHAGTAEVDELRKQLQSVVGAAA
jgi:hypothetical protein